MIQANKKKGFTLVELLAVIVILAIILVIAVPKIMSVIEDSKKATLESTAKMIASSAEKQKIQNTILGKEDEITCDSVAQINKMDYAECSIEFEDNTAKVTIAGSGKFKDLWVCKGDKTSATAQTEECPLVCGVDEVVLIRAVADKPYVVKDYDKCIDYLEPIIDDEDQLISTCENRVIEYYSFENLVYDLIVDEYFTEEELISNNIVASDSVWESNITLGNYNSCINYMTEIYKVLNWQEFIDEQVPTLCSGEPIWSDNFSQDLLDIMNIGNISKEELLENNVIGADSVFTNIKPENKTSCVNNLKEVYVDDWGNSQEDLETLCSGKDIVFTTMNLFVELGGYSEKKLIQNDIIEGKLGQQVCVKLTPAECFDFEDGVITGYDITCGTDIVIPNQINGEDVVGIGNRAFYDLDITSVNLPSMLEYIGNSAFSLNNISELEIPNKVTSIGSATFSNNNISELEIPSSVEEISSFAFDGNPLIKLNLGNLDASTSNCSFGWLNDITTHNLPDDYEYKCAPI